MRVSGYNIVTRHRSRKLNKYLYKHFYIFLFWLNKESCFKRGKNERRVWRYQRGNQNLYIKEEDNTMAKRKSTKGQTRSTKHTHKTKDRVTRTPLITGGELRCSGRVGSSCSTSDTCQLIIVYIFLYKCTIIDKCALPCTISMLLLI